MNKRQAEYEARKAHEAKRKTKRRDHSPILAKIRKLPCRVCAASRTEAHHIVPRSQWSSLEKAAGEHNHPHNLMALCHACHQDHHTTVRRVGKHLLTPDEHAFALAKMGPGWVAKWYP